MESDRHFMRKNKKGKASLFLQAYLPVEECAMLFSFEIALPKFNSLIFNSAKSFCTYILPLTVNVEVVLLLLLLLFFAQE
jgi:hypothetical protein